MVIPDPNTFGGGGAITITRPLTEAVVPPAPVVQEVVDVPQEGVLAGRGLGVLDMARSIRAGRPHVATGRIGYHVLDTLLSIEEAALSTAVRAGGEHGRRGGLARGRLRPAGRDAVARGACSARARQTLTSALSVSGESTCSIASMLAPSTAAFWAAAD